MSSPSAISYTYLHGYKVGITAKDGRLICPLGCGNAFVGPDSLLAHISKKHYICPHCPDRTFVGIRKHLRMHEEAA